MFQISAIILIVMLSFSFSSMNIEKNDDDGRLRFTTGELYHLSGDPETSVRHYLINIADKLGLKNPNIFPLEYLNLGKTKQVIFLFNRYILESLFLGDIYMFTQIIT